MKAKHGPRTNRNRNFVEAAAGQVHEGRPHLRDGIKSDPPECHHLGQGGTQSGPGDAPALCMCIVGGGVRQTAKDVSNCIVKDRHHLGAERHTGRAAQKAAPGMPLHSAHARRRHRCRRVQQRMSQNAPRNERNEAGGEERSVTFGQAAISNKAALLIKPHRQLHALNFTEHTSSSLAPRP